jgi:hypothetical protein
MIARQQAELQTLQREYEARQTNLADLNRRKEELKAQLRQIEADIQATAQGGSPSPAPAPKKAAKVKRTKRRRRAKARAMSATPVPQAGAPRPHTLPALLLEIVQKASGPVTVKQLADDVVRRKFPTTSSNISAMVETRAHELVRKGLLQRATGGQPGFVPVRSAPKAAAKNGAVAAKPSPSKTDGQRQQPPLRVVLTNLLAKNKRPMTARELAEQALAGGYQTKSKNFIDVMWVALGQMNNIRNVAGKGYVLKR